MANDTHSQVDPVGTYLPIRKHRLEQMKNFVKMEKCPVIAAINKKGGVGKTFFSCAIGTVAANAGLRVLIIETCEQNNTVNLMARDRMAALSLKKGGVIEMMRNPLASPKPFIFPSTVDNLYIMPAVRGMSQTFSRRFETDFPNRYLSAVKGLESLRRGFDLILIDSPPNDDLLPISVLAACSHYFFIRDSDMNAGEGIRQMQMALDEIKKYNGAIGECLGVLLNDRSKNPSFCAKASTQIQPPPFNYINKVIPYSKKPINFASGSSLWLKDAFKGQRANSPLEVALYDFTHFIFEKTGLLKAEEE